MVQFFKKGLNQHAEKLSESKAQSEAYLFFFNSLPLNINLIRLVSSKKHCEEKMAGWQGLQSLTCIAENQTIYDLDVRCAWGEEIFKQNLVDHGWTEETLLYRRHPGEQKRHKVIVYLCEASTGVGGEPKLERVPQQFVIGSYWETVQHLYLPLPIDHPFPLPTVASDTNQVSGYATTRRLTKEPPVGLQIDNDLRTLLFLPPHIKRQGEGGLRRKGFYKQPSAKKPLISVITVVFNGESYLEQAIQSVVNQSYDNLEYIVIDGGSTDATVEIIKKYDSQIDYWVSEPDGGIYDAMNKGTLVASGSHTWHINSDDLIFQASSLQNVFKDTNYSSVNLSRGVLVFLVHEKCVIQRLPKKPQPDKYINLLTGPAIHQGFIGFKNYRSQFDPSYKICADSITMYDKLSVEPSNIASDIIAIFRSGGTHEDNFQGIKELRRAISTSKNLTIYLKFSGYAIYCWVREIAKSVGIVSLKRKYLNKNFINSLINQKS